MVFCQGKAQDVVCSMLYFLLVTLCSRAQCTLSMLLDCLCPCRAEACCVPDVYLMTIEN